MKQYILILSVLLLQACNSNKPNDEQAAPVASNDIRLTDKEKENAHIETGKLERRNVSSILKVNGIVDVPPQNMISEVCLWVVTLSLHSYCQVCI